MIWVIWVICWCDPHATWWHAAASLSLSLACYPPPQPPLPRPAPARPPSGILLWELVTGGRAFTGVPKPLLGHAIVQQRLRPVWPPPVVGPAWTGLRRLTERCWAHDAVAR